MEIFISQKVSDTQKIASDLVKKMGNQKVIALVGDLGSGKTTFTQGFAKALGIKDKIISPTFVLIRQHPFSKGQTLYHIDLYRLEENMDIENLGISEILNSPNNITLIEWAEKIKNDLPKNTIWINLKKISESKRQIFIKM